MEENRETEVLLAEVREGSDSAFSSLCDRYGRLLDAAVGRFATGLCEADVAELEQEAKIAFFRAAQDYRLSAEVTFGLYARVCVRNALVSWYRKRDRKVVLCSWEDHIDSLLGGFAEEPYAALSAAESLREMYRRIAAVLSPYERQVFDLHLEGQSAAEIGARLGKTEKSVYNATARTLAKLRAEFGS